MTTDPALRYVYLDTPDRLAEWCAALTPGAAVAIDTEFERQRTYYAELCLAQLAVDGEVACIDTLAVRALAPLASVLGDPDRRILLHAARQDLEVLQQAGAACGAPLADTQVAAALAGFHEQIGYADLVRELLGVDLDKSQTRTDWRQRPLSARQLAYAADDVRHLAAVEHLLRERLAGLGRLAWYEADCAALATANFEQAPETAWERVKGLPTLAAAGRARAMALAAWRERRAQTRNLPRNWVLKDADLLALASAAPPDVEAVVAAWPGNATTARRLAPELLEAMQAADPADAQRSAPLPVPDATQRELVRRCAAAVRAAAETLAIAPAVLLTRREIEQLVAGSVPTRLAGGWRSEVLAGVMAQFAGASVP